MKMLSTRHAIVLAILAVACARSTQRASESSTIAAITTADLEYRLRIIADDSMMGRESGSEGDYRTADYVASEFRRLGLEPAGENATYFQAVPFWSVAVDSASRLAVDGTPLELGRDFFPGSSNVSPRQLESIEVVYGGVMGSPTGMVDPATVANKFVIFTPPNGPNRGANLGGFMAARALAIVNLDQLPPEFLARLREGRPVADTTTTAARAPVVYLSRAAAAKLLGAAPEGLTAGAAGHRVSGFVGYRYTPVKFPARNVVAIMRGSDPALRGEYVSLSAHNDHVGFDHAPVDHDSLRAFNRVIRPMGADSPPRPPTDAEWTQIRTILDSLRRVHKPRLDSIRNGADDDGSGTVSILEIAEAMARGTHPRRSILFVNHTGEEAGLLGSRWFTDHPTVPLDSIIGEIDQDMVGRGMTTDFPYNGVRAGTPQYLEVIGAKRLSKQFGEALDSANAHQPIPFVFNLEYDQPGHPLQYYCRADHYSYARYGIPSLALSRGEHLDYHQVTDEAQYIDYVDLARVTHMVYDMTMSLANAPSRPQLDVPKPDPHGQCRQ